MLSVLLFLGYCSLYSPLALNCWISSLRSFDPLGVSDTSTYLYIFIFLLLLFSMLLLLYSFDIRLISVFWLQFGKGFFTLSLFVFWFDLVLWLAVLLSCIYFVFGHWFITGFLDFIGLVFAPLALSGCRVLSGLIPFTCWCMVRLFGVLRYLCLNFGFKFRFLILDFGFLIHLWILDFRF